MPDSAADAEAEGALLPALAEGDATELSALALVATAVVRAGGTLDAAAVARVDAGGAALGVAGPPPVGVGPTAVLDAEPAAVTPALAVPAG